MIQKIKSLVIMIMLFISLTSLLASGSVFPKNLPKEISLKKVNVSLPRPGIDPFTLGDDSEVLFEAQLTDEAIVVSCQNADSDVRIVITSHSGWVYADTIVGSDWIEISTEGWSTDSYILYVYYEDELWLGEFQL